MPQSAAHGQPVTGLGTAGPMADNGTRGAGMPRAQWPALQRGLLTRDLHQLRTAAGMTLHQVAAGLYISTSKVQRMENGTSRVSVPDLRALLELYGVTDPGRIAGMTELA